MKKKLFVILAVMVCVFILAACGPKSVTLDVDMAEFKFSPNRLEVPAGGEVTVNFNNIGALEHDMVIMALGSEATIPFDADDHPNVYWEYKVQPGGEESVVFTAPSEPGEYQIVCGIPAHLEQGMVATLVVK
jgi:uncharacterized cupredoxin-like copper-binding protein